MPSPTSTPTPDPFRLVAEDTWRDTVQLKLWVLDDVVAPGGALQVRVRLDNLSDKGVEYTMWNIADPVVYTRI